MVAAIRAIEAVSRHLGKLGKLDLIVVAGALVFGGAVSLVGSVPMSESGLKLWTLTYGGFVVGVALFVHGFREYHRRSLVRNTPTSRVQSLAMGMVELFGAARPAGETLSSPFSGEDCVTHMYRIEEWDDSGKHSHWKLLDAGAAENTFYLDDGTGKVLVDTEGSDLRIPPDNQFEVGSFEELPAAGQEFVRQNPSVDTQEGEWFEERRRYTEYYIEPGEEMYVFGKAMPREGHGGSSVNPENAVINRDSDTPMFVVSDKSEKELVSSMGWAVVSGTFGGFALSVLGFGGLVLVVGLF